MLQSTMAVFMAATSFVSTNVSPLPLQVYAETIPPITVEEKIELKAKEKGIDPLRVLAIAKAESEFNPEAINPNGDDSGVFQFQKETFVEKCIEKYKFATSTDQKNDVDVQIDCATELMKDGQWWRWASSRDRWDPDYVGCNCIASARLKDPKIPFIDASKFVPNTDIPRVGDLMILKYLVDGKWVYHIALIGEITEAGRKTDSEGNYFKCIITSRTVKWGDPAFVGYWHNPQNQE